MHADLGAQIAVGVIAVDLDRRALDAGDFARRFLEQFGLEAGARSSAGTCAAASRPSPAPRCRRQPAWMSMKHVRGIHRIVEHPAELQVLDDLLQAGHVGAHGFKRGIVGIGPRHLEELAAVPQAGVERPIVRTTPSSCFFSLPRSCARCGSSQIFGSSSVFSTSTRRSDFTSKSKIPPQIGGARPEIRECGGDLVDLFGVHGVASFRCKR